MNKILIAILGIFAPVHVMAMGEDDPVLMNVMINQFEIRDTTGSNLRAWDATVWFGRDLQKVWVKSEGERIDSDTESQELRLLYGQAIAPFWDVMIGMRTDLDPSPERNWLEFGIQGLTPYFFEINASLFLGGGGRSGIRFDSEYEFLITQKWILSPEIEINFHAHNDEETGVGSGLSNIEAGLRLRYEIRREFAPYIGINWEKSYGKTANFSRASSEDVSDTKVVIGIRMWF